MNKLRIPALLCLMVLSLGVAACDNADEEPPTAAPTPPTPPPPPPPPAPPAPTTASFSGTVSNDKNSRIAGATVTAIDGPNAGQVAMTNANGEFSFPSLQIANTNFRVNSGGYLEVRGGAYVDGNATLSFTFMRARLIGTVKDHEGTGLAGAVVTLIDGPQAGQTAGTDGSGNFSFDSMPIDNINALAEADGYTQDARGTFVNGTNTLNFVIEPVQGHGEGGGEGGTPTASLTLEARVVGSTEWRFDSTTNIDPNEILHYNWQFGDGSGAGASYASEQHLYTQTGTYTVTVEAVLRSNAVVTASITIEVRN